MPRLFLNHDTVCLHGSNDQWPPDAYGAQQPEKRCETLSTRGLIQTQHPGCFGSFFSGSIHKHVPRETYEGDHAAFIFTSRRGSVCARQAAQVKVHTAFLFGDDDSNCRVCDDNIVEFGVLSGAGGVSSLLGVLSGVKLTERRGWHVHVLPTHIFLLFGAAASVSTAVWLKWAGASHMKQLLLCNAVPFAVACQIGCCMGLERTDFRPCRGFLAHKVSRDWRSHTVRNVIQSVSDVQCEVCLQNLAPGEELRVLPCLHQYHVLCIDEWCDRCRARRKAPTCPTCRAIVTANRH